MKLSIAFLLMSAAVLAGCSRPVVRETVVERPVYVDRPVVVQQPAAAGASAASCTFASQSYSHGSMSCQDRTAFRCDNGTWTRTLNAC
jgi:hypothetical protein